jgi:hypothetical protein
MGLVHVRDQKEYRFSLFHRGKGTGNTVDLQRHRNYNIIAEGPKSH